MMLFGCVPGQLTAERIMEIVRLAKKTHGLFEQMHCLHMLSNLYVCVHQYIKAPKTNIVLSDFWRNERDTLCAICSLEVIDDVRAFPNFECFVKDKDRPKILRRNLRQLLSDFEKHPRADPWTATESIKDATKYKHLTRLTWTFFGNASENGFCKHVDAKIAKINGDAAINRRKLKRTSLFVTDPTLNDAVEQVRIALRSLNPMPYMADGHCPIRGGCNVGWMAKLVDVASRYKMLEQEHRRLNAAMTAADQRAHDARAEAKSDSLVHIVKMELFVQLDLLSKFMKTCLDKCKQARSAPKRAADQTLSPPAAKRAATETQEAAGTAPEAATLTAAAV